MGYTTDFTGNFKINKKLDKQTYDLLTDLATTRRMVRNVEGFGIDGEFYTLDRDDFGQGKNINIVDYNKPPRTQLSLWCHWIPTKDGTKIKFDGGEKFYNYGEWLTYLIDKVLAPNGYKLNGEAEWKSEDSSDLGIIRVIDNVILLHSSKVVYAHKGIRQN
jgi:hypothetical protein